MAADEPLPAGLVLTAPRADLTLADPRIPGTEPQDPVLSRAFLRASPEAYAQRAAADDPLLSPLNGRLSGLPPVHLDVGTRDILVHGRAGAGRRPA